MKDTKRITLFCGHYGSGKTNLAVNFAKKLKNEGKSVVIADLDIVNPYFRTKDSEQELKGLGIELICSQYANSNLDIPALPADMYRTVEDKNTYAVLDVGGDDSGAVALGRLSEKIREENNFEMIFVANFFRPLTRTAKEAYNILLEIEKACGISFTAIVNNSNLGNETTAEDILRTDEKARELSALCGLPVIMTSAVERLCEEIGGVAGEIFPMTLQKKYFDINA
ncbi:MAG: hypothetical protein ACI4XE_09335 [Acutalibacteraceae bacterium]